MSKFYDHQTDDGAFAADAKEVYSMVSRQKLEALKVSIEQKFLAEATPLMRQPGQEAELLSLLKVYGQPYGTVLTQMGLIEGGERP